LYRAAIWIKDLDLPTPAIVDQDEALVMSFEKVHG
jgi:hypothetical protein